MNEGNMDWIERAQRVFTPNYRPAPIALERGEGVWLVDVEGQRYLDMISGIAVSSLGHGHPALVQAIQRQVGLLLHTSNIYWNCPSIRLAELLVRESFAHRVFLCNSGTEANEAAIKLARRSAYDRGEVLRTQVLTFTGSFHGRTYGALAATAQPKYHQGFGPMPEGFAYLPYGDLQAAREAIGANTAAVLVEPIQGEGGVNVAPEGFLAGLRALTLERGALLIFDEVQVGIGRTGRRFAYEHEGVIPDVMTLAKGLGGGLPIGALLASDTVAASLTPGTHGTTFGGNPVACAAAEVVLETVWKPEFLSRVTALGDQLRDGLNRLNQDLSVFDEVRGRGLIAGAQLRAGLPFSASDVVNACRMEGVLTHVAGPSVLRLAPPLIIDAEELEVALAAIRRAVSKLVP
jgi:acetylornithine/N-succinyldiaminopimelate aminotransferase